ncbi:MAG: PilZ domain-containing protein [Spirochaetaceae bacterium]|jgi:c-di-GMP-binding flagellar brake protein YcgR|nr:PilZ domain-containing protein [Spirochaetaceae bacterium]
MWIVLFLLLIAFVITIILLSGDGKKWREFYINGTDAGFSLSEMKMLKKAAEQAGLENPTTIFFSIDMLDHSISVLSDFVDENGIEYTPGESELLKKLYEYRKTIEFNKPRYKNGLRHTLELKEGQEIRIALGKSGLFYSEILEIDENYLTISYPTGNTLPQGVTWRGQNLRVYFQKSNDASYYFETHVKDDYYDRTFKLLHIAHSKSILRSQRRKSIRTKAEIPVTIYPLNEISQVDNLLLSEGGFRGEMLDISEDGASIVIGGKGKDGLLIKIQFQLENSVIVICGVIRYFDYIAESDRSVLHLQFTRPDDETRNKILSYVYDVHRKILVDTSEEGVDFSEIIDYIPDEDLEEAELLEMMEEEDIDTN